MFCYANMVKKIRPNRDLRTEKCGNTMLFIIDYVKRRLKVEIYKKEDGMEIAQI